MMSLSLPRSLPRAPLPPRIAAPPSFHRFALFRLSSVKLRASLDSEPSRLSVRRSVTAKLQVERFASISSSDNQETSVGVNPQYPVPPPPSNIRSCLFWIGCGVAFSAVFLWVAGWLKYYIVQKFVKTVMNQMITENDQLTNAAFSPGSPLQFPPAPASPSASPLSASSQPSTDVSATRVDESPPASSTTPSSPATDVKDTEESKKQNKYETVHKSPFESSFSDTSTSSSKETRNNVEGSQNGAAFKQGIDASMGSETTGKVKYPLSVEALEKILQDPTVQKILYPYLPEELRNPTTFKWMLDNPQYRQQLQDMLRNMSGSSDWDNRMMDSLKNFDLSSPEVKQQFDQIGITPEEVISKIVANPDVAMAFQNPRVQAAIMDCSQGPHNIEKYRYDKEVMDVLDKISELFPGVSGPP